MHDHAGRRLRSADDRIGTVIYSGDPGRHDTVTSVALEPTTDPPYAPSTVWRRASGDVDIGRAGRFWKEDLLKCRHRRSASCDGVWIVAKPSHQRLGDRTLRVNFAIENGVVDHVITLSGRPIRRLRTRRSLER